MSKYYKLTDEKDQTYNQCQWGEGVEHTAPGEGKLCTEGWIHCYDHLLLAVFLNPIHGGYNLITAHLWECEVSGKIKEDRGLKFGVEKLKTLKRISLPIVTQEQRIRLRIRNSSLGELE